MCRKQRFPVKIGGSFHSHRVTAEQPGKQGIAAVDRHPKMFQNQENGARSSRTPPCSAKSFEKSIKGNNVGKTVLNHKRSPFCAPSAERRGCESRSARISAGNRADNIFYIWHGSAFLSLKSNIKIDYIYVDRKWLIPFGSLKTGIPNKERTNERQEKVFRITIINGYTEQ